MRKESLQIAIECMKNSRDKADRLGLSEVAGVGNMIDRAIEDLEAELLSQ